MLKFLLEGFKSLLNLTDDTKQNKEDNKVLQTKYEAMHNDVRQLAWEMIADRRVAAEQRENMLLRVEAMVKDNDQRALPPGTASQDQITVILARLDALEKENKDLKTRIAALENP